MKIDADILRSLRDTDCLYAARCGNRRWIKIGFSSRITNRLGQLDSAFPQYAPFIPLGVCQSSWRAEQQLHRALRSLHADDCREIYPAIPGIEHIVQQIVDRKHISHCELDVYFKLKGWAKQAAISLRSAA
jgi:hypothetical protein